MHDTSLYNQWIRSIDLSKSKVSRLPSLILLCGGEISSDCSNFKSCRDIFYRYINDNRTYFADDIVLVEDVFKYFEHSSYSNLLEFEQDLAELSALTVLFSESPGSIAEFGSFSVLKNIQDRLLVVMHQEDSYKESFIWRGPALYLKALAKEKGAQDPISIYYWRKRYEPEEHLCNEDFSDAEDLSDTITSILSNRPKAESWEKSKIGHIMLLLLDLLKVLQLSTLDEIINTLKNLGIEQKRKTVERYLSMLISLQFVIRKPYRHNVYYLSGQHEQWIKFGFRKGAKTKDLDRWRVLFREYYEKNDTQKIRALRSHLKSIGSVGD